ncbi:MAG: tRNA (guanosine(46)-N7)-methyltransferase TrmB [Candidatus Gracilibacteria bacterium]
MHRENNPYMDLVEKHDSILIKESELFNKFGKWNDFFGNKKEIFLEIGTGMGNFFSKESLENKNKNFIGIEIKYKRLYNTALKTINAGVKDFILLKTFGQNIDKLFKESEISKTYIFFPDPWGKKDRQKKHRLFQEKFIRDLYLITKTGGTLIFKTDHREYFDTTLNLFKKIGLWKINIKSYNYEKELDNHETKNMTEFEHVFRGKQINYVEFEK